jgi:hypothetical protein
VDGRKFVSDYYNKVARLTCCKVCGLIRWSFLGRKPDLRLNKICPQQLVPSRFLNLLHQISRRSDGQAQGMRDLVP